MQISEKYKNKRIAILGYATEGVATLDYLRAHGLDADILDQMETSEFLEKHPEVDTKKLVLGSQALKNLTNYDVVVKTPGFRPNLPEIVKAKEEGVEFTSQVELFFDLCPCEIIGVTGTKGKGTTSTMIYQILKAAGRDVYLGGNIGTPALTFVDRLNKDSIVVLELSSFQLQVLEKSPHIAVILNVTSEHLDYHKDTNEYREAKANIANYQTEYDFAVISGDYDVPAQLASESDAQKYYFSRFKKVDGCYVDERDDIRLSYDGNSEEIANASEVLLRGRHNLENITAAALASSLAGVEASVISEVIKNFHGLEHRLELVRELDGVRYYDDSFSTVPETAIAAIESFVEPMVLIAGGSSKNSDYTDLGKKIAGANLRALILIGATAEEIEASIPGQLSIPVIKGLTKMTDIVTAAKRAAKEGDIILLSPACASKGLFENYKDRGDQFKAAVNNL